MNRAFYWGFIHLLERVCAHHKSPKITSEPLLVIGLSSHFALTSNNQPVTCRYKL